MAGIADATVGSPGISGMDPMYQGFPGAAATAGYPSVSATAGFPDAAAAAGFAGCPGGAAEAGFAGFPGATAMAGFPGDAAAAGFPGAAAAAGFAGAEPLPFGRAKGGKGKGKSTGLPGEVGEVRFDSAEAAQRASQLLNGSVILGTPIQIIPDMSSQDGTKVLVQNLPAGIEWQELKDHCSQAGTVCFASISRKGCGKGAAGGSPPAGGYPAPAPAPRGGPPCVGEVRFTMAEEAAMAMAAMNGSDYQGNTISVEPDRSASDGTKILILNLPGGTQWQELKDHFQAVGKVVFAGISGARRGGGAGGGAGAAAGAGAWAGAGGGAQGNAYGNAHGNAYGNAHGGAGGGPGGACGNGFGGAHGGGAYGAAGGACGSACGGAGNGVFSNAFRGAQGPYGATGAFQQQGFQGANPRPGKGAYGPAQGLGRAAPVVLAGEVRFERAEHAEQAVKILDGSIFNGHTISVVQDGTSKDGSRLLVGGLPPGTSWPELKEQFSVVGNVAYAGVNSGLGKGGGHFAGGAAAHGQAKGGHFAGGAAAAHGQGGGATGLVGELRFELAQHAQLALGQMNGSIMRGTRITVVQNTSSQDGSKLHVFNLPPGCAWQELKDHFQLIGPVAFAAVHRGIKGEAPLPQHGAFAAAPEAAVAQPCQQDPTLDPSVAMGMPEAAAAQAPMQSQAPSIDPALAEAAAAAERGLFGGSL